MKTVLDIFDLKDKKVLVRVDFNVPVSEKGQIEESFKIKKQKETIDYLVNAGAKALIISHITAIDTFSDLIPQFHIILGREIGFIKDIADIGGHLNNFAGPMLLENIRRFPGEKENSMELAEKLAKGFDAYVNDAFAECHRNYASVSAIAKLLPSYAGLLVQEEVAQLQKAADAPKLGKVVIIGGAKAETKVPVIRNFMDKAELILLGGVVANDVLKEKGWDVGNSVVDENSKELLVGLDIHNPKLLVPEDFVIFDPHAKRAFALTAQNSSDARYGVGVDNKILDIGEKTIRKYADAISRASMVIWNGPMGFFEDPSFAKGTNELAKAIVASNARKIVGGGDTITALGAVGLLGKVSAEGGDFISTGGGAMLTFLSGEELPGLKALDYYK